MVSGSWFIEKGRGTGVMSVPTLQTNRLLIRPFEVQDEEWLIPLHQNLEVMRYSPGGILTVEEVSEMIKSVLQVYKLRGFGLNGCWIKESMTPIGFCGVFLRELEGVIYPELGYRLFPEFWLKGYATEAAIAVKNDAFDRIKLSRIFSFIDCRNTRSIRVAQKVGEQFAFNATYKGVLFSIYTIQNSACIVSPKN
jgi:[ribosomal protein S5]-alanine N-acetyltransferase